MNKYVRFRYVLFKNSDKTIEKRLNDYWNKIKNWIYLAYEINKLEKSGIYIKMLLAKDMETEERWQMHTRMNKPLWPSKMIMLNLCLIQLNVDLIGNNVAFVT